MDLDETVRVPNGGRVMFMHRLLCAFWTIIAALSR